LSRKARLCTASLQLLAIIIILCTTTTKRTTLLPATRQHPHHSSTTHHGLLVFNWDRAHRLLQLATGQQQQQQQGEVLEATKMSSSFSSYSDQQECPYSNDKQVLLHAVEQHNDGMTGDDNDNDLDNLDTES
jgi:hypothetical protein